MTASEIYKIISKDEWAAAEAVGVFKGASIDLTDGFIHFSTAAQAPETAALHFTEQEGLLLVSVSTDALGDALKWETSRGGDLFPHLYVSLEMRHVARVDDLPVGPDGRHAFPAHVIAAGESS
ncbi:DUF952 domain-containing protein [Parvibaculaceae bacterium PLY_AMNH_Bact1]|nr:DUF952 domain-containing protein [Parvibaculaceae bacterium PLY_AMNH_Bact1]